LKELEGVVKAGLSTEDINIFVHDRIIAEGGIPSTLNYRGYPKSCCTSINDVICHGIPNPKIILKNGDIINIDVTTYKGGFHGDASAMYLVGGEGSCSKAAVDLVHHTRR
jgi:methionyl aminopeptidase